MAKMGRPKKEAPKVKMAGVRLTPEEHERLARYAENHNQTITEALLDGIHILYERERELVK